MKLFDKQVPANSLEARLDAKHVDAAREYLGRFLDDKPADRDRLVQAVDKSIEVISGLGDGFTAETVRGMLGRYVRDLDDVSKVIGGRIRAAAKRGDIYTLGETIIAHRPSAHSRRMLVWYGKGYA